MTRATQRLIDLAAGGKRNVAAALRARLVDGMTVRGAAAKAGVSKTTVVKYEQRVRKAGRSGER